MSENLEATLKVALIQMQSQFDVLANAAQAKAFLLEAVNQHQAKFIVYPESFLCLGVDNYSDYYQQFNSIIDEFKQLALQHKVSILLGSIPVASDSSPKKSFSRSILINEQGNQEGAYDKMHLFDAAVNDAQGVYCESNQFEAGRDLQVLDVATRKLGMSICYDLRFPKLYQSLRDLGAEILAVPSAFTYKTGEAHWEVLLRARAIETQSFVLAANQCGAHTIEKSGTVRKTWGHSMIIDPWGRVLSSLRHVPGVCSAELNFDELQAVRQSMNLMQHKRLSSNV